MNQVHNQSGHTDFFIRVSERKTSTLFSVSVRSPEGEKMAVCRILFDLIQKPGNRLYLFGCKRKLKPTGR
jgi:hypothetical protein